MCELLGVSKQAYYKHEDQLVAKLAEEAFVVEFIKEIRGKDMGIGGNKLWKMYLDRFGVKNSVGLNRFYDIIEKYNLKIRKRKRRVSTTNSDHPYPLYPNIIKDVIPDHPNQIWVSDITYIPFWVDKEKDQYDFCYLSIITDTYTKEVIGYQVGDTLETVHSIKALHMALNRLGGVVPADLIHHSDRGIQYASTAYTDILKDNGITISMTESGNPKDNAIAERINNTIKNELLMGVEFFDIESVRIAVRQAVDFYNNERPHMSLDGMTPSQAAQKIGRIKKDWISYRENAIDRCSIQK